MPGRLPSPALSENLLDISQDLTGNSAGVATGIDSDSFLSNDGPNHGSRGLDPSNINSLYEDDDEDDEAYLAAQQAASNRKTNISTNTKQSSTKKSGGFQSLGLNASLLKAIIRKGFSVPTPIQRKVMPLILDGQDVVGMARTGSGKTAAFVIPIIEKLKSHSAKVGARALILSPSRELAVQTLRAVKDFGQGTDLRSMLVVGGDSLDDQFEQMTSNPDIIIATPGRFLHLLVEMSLSLSSIQYAVFDEADRLFEMGFAAQLAEVLHSLPLARQTLLFSATLPKTLVEFARAGLKEPQLIRLDADTKISPDLENAFLFVKSAEKDGALLHVISDLINVPASGAPQPQSEPTSKKRKRFHTSSKGNLDPPTNHSTIVFAATKHRVEYLQGLLAQAGYPVAYIYGSLDQSARKRQIGNFRSGIATILVVTDVAARGIDIPLLANVVNYDFPPHPKIFVHRVGRTARAGSKGWSYNLVQSSDLPYLLDLQLFLGKSFLRTPDEFNPTSFRTDIVIGTIPPTKLEPRCETVNKMLTEEEDLAGQQTVATKGDKLYYKTRGSASTESVKRVKTLSSISTLQTHSPLYKDEVDTTASERVNMIARISGFRPAETVFEIGRRGHLAEAGAVIQKQREKRRQKQLAQQQYQDDATTAEAVNSDTPRTLADQHASEEMQSDTSEARENNHWQDSENFISYKPRETNLGEDRGYGVHSGAPFAGAAREVTMDLVKDDSRGFGEASRPSQMRWDKRGKKYVARANEEDGSKGPKKIVGESGQKIAASFKSGRFDAWRKANRLDRLPRNGEMENSRGANSSKPSQKFKHHAQKAPKALDKYRDDFHKKRKRLAEQQEASGEGHPAKRKARNELRSVDDIRKQRLVKQQRREKNARPSKKGKKKTK